MFEKFSSVQSLSHVQLFATPWTATCQASLSIANSRSLLKLMSIELVRPSNHIILCCPLLPPSIFLASGSFLVSQFFTSGGQSVGVSASVLPIKVVWKKSLKSWKKVVWKVVPCKKKKSATKRFRRENPF